MDQSEAKRLRLKPLNSLFHVDDDDDDDDDEEFDVRGGGGGGGRGVGAEQRGAGRKEDEDVDTKRKNRTSKEIFEVDSIFGSLGTINSFTGESLEKDDYWQIWQTNLCKSEYASCTEEKVGVSNSTVFETLFYFCTCLWYMINV